MSLQEAKQLLDEASPNEDFNQLASALAIVSKQIRAGRTDRELYASIVRSVLDAVAPRLATTALEVYKNASEDFDLVFLQGHPAIAFSELCSVLGTKEERSEVVARTLILFVDRSIGGVDRLRSVLGSSELPDFLSALIHLPSRIATVMYSDSNETPKYMDMFKEDEYYSTLAEAILFQPNMSDPQRDQALSELLERLVKLKQSDTIVSRWLERGSEQQMVIAMLRTPQNCIDQLIRALLNVRTDSRALTEKITNVLGVIVRESRTACESCVSRIPFQRPLFKRPRTALKRLIKALKRGAGNKVLIRALNRAADLWTSEQLSKYGDIQLQRQVTRLLLYYMRYTAKLAEAEGPYDENSLILTLVNGVHFRLDANDTRVRRLGMVIGEAASRYSGDEEPLTFERQGMTEARQQDARITGDDRFEDGGDSDFSDLAVCVTENPSENDCNSIENVDGFEFDTSRSPQNAKGANINSTKPARNVEDINLNSFHKKNAPKRPRAKDQNVWSIANSTEVIEGVEDDWSSLDSYELTDDSGGESNNASSAQIALGRDYDAVRKKIAAPFSVARLLGLLREVNQTDGGALRVDAETTTAALRTVAARAEGAFGTKGTTLHACCIELCLEVVHVEPDRYPDEFMPAMIEARRNAMQRLLEMDIVECGVALVERVICGTSTVIGKRSECLGVLTAAVRGAHERAVQAARDDAERREQAAAAKASAAKEQQVGTVIKRKPKVSKASGGGKGVGISHGWDDEGLGRVFDALASGLCRGGGAEFIDVAGRDNQLWAQGIVTLSVIAGVGGVSEEGARMRGDVVEIAVDRVLGESEADAIVRRGCALAMGGAVEAMTDWEIEGKVVSGLAREDSIGLMLTETQRDERKIVRRAAEWLEKAVQDEDVGVRRFAVRALRIWADRVQ